MKILYLFLLFFCIGCSVNKNVGCDENESFKSVFFKNIEIVEKHALKQYGKGDFLQALNFISQYAPVSYEKIYNYQVEYPNYEIFCEDKVVWLKWYEENKCKNLTLKE